MEFKEILARIDGNTYQQLKTAVEIGRWANGLRLTEEQRALSLQALIAYEIEQNMDDHERTGYVNTEKSSCHTDQGTQPLKWQ